MVRRFVSVHIHTAQLEKHPEITLQDVPKLDCILRLFVDDEKRKLQTKDDRIWTPVERLYVLWCITPYNH